MHDIQTLALHKYMGEWHTWLGVYMNYLNAYILAAVVLGVIAYIVYWYIVFNSQSYKDFSFFVHCLI